MFNPYRRYEAQYLPKFKMKGVKAFVQQTYDRGRDLLAENPRPAFLLTHYEDLIKAEGHMDALKHDPNRRLFKMDDPEDYRELYRLGQRDCGAQVYLYFMFPDADARARRALDKKLHAYIDFKLKWRIPSLETAEFYLEYEFGEIYAVLKHGGRYHRVKFEEIETMKGYVL
jgi:hypothetical protein